MYFDIDVYFKLCYIYYMLFVPLWDSCYSDVVFFFFFYSNFLSYLFSPSNFFLLMIWNVRCLNGQHGSLMLIFGVENPGSLQLYQSWRLSDCLGSVAWLSRDGVSNALDWVECIYTSEGICRFYKNCLYCGDLLVE